MSTCASPPKRSPQRSPASRRQLLRSGTLRARSAERLFARSPRYIGHSLAVPRSAISRAAQESEGGPLLRTRAGLQLVSNVCRHRQAVMLRGRGNHRAQHVCPLHRWTYDLGGQLIGAPTSPTIPARDLENFRCQTWNGMVFDVAGAPRRDVAAELAGIGPSRDLDFTGYAFDSVKLHECDYNWKTFIEVYLEDYHVAPSHPGPGRVRHLRRPALGVRPAPFGADRRAQERARQAGVGRVSQVARRRARLSRRPLRRPRAAPRRDLAHLLPGDDGRVVPARAGRLDARSERPQKTLNIVEFYYPEDIHAFEREFVEAEQAAYWETCAEDDEIALRMDAGRRALFDRGEDDFGPYQSPMEDGMQQFHEWYERAMLA
jgi:phenylpropionate dioxygenase-like ring-hydroxylating dioxygenase large terminal subunit